MMDIVQIFNSAAEWISNPQHQMGVVLAGPVVICTAAMLVMRHRDKKEAQSAKGPGPD